MHRDIIDYVDITYEYRSQEYGFTRAEIASYLEDNNLEPTWQTIYSIQKQFWYFKFIHIVYRSCEQLPLFNLNYETAELTEYHPPVPPRTLPAYNADFHIEASVLVQTLASCIALHPQKQHDVGRYLEDGIQMDDYLVLDDRNFQENPFGRGFAERQTRIEYILNHGYHHENELWLEKHGVLFPASLPHGLSGLFISPQHTLSDRDSHAIMIQLAYISRQYSFGIRSLF